MNGARELGQDGGPDPRPRASGLEGRWIRSAWRNASILHALEEVDALEREEAHPESGEAVDLPGRVTRSLLAKGLPGRLDRVFCIRPWTHHERAQRGRSPEFWCLSARLLHDTTARADAAAIAAAIEPLRALGVGPQHVKVRISHRDAVRSLLLRRGVPEEHLGAWFPLLHQAGKMSNDDFISGAGELGMESRTAVDVLRVLNMSTPFEAPTTQLFLSEQAGGRGPEYFKALFAELRELGVQSWCVLNLGIVRRGAHHTGMVFEVHDAVGRGRSIAGGGRSVTLWGDVEVQSVGFDMGDTALAEMLREQGIMPGTRQLADACRSRCGALVCAMPGDDALAGVMALVVKLRSAGISAREAAEPLPDLGAAQALARTVQARAVVLLGGGAGDAVRVVGADALPDTGVTVPAERLVEHLTGWLGD